MKGTVEYFDGTTVDAEFDVRDNGTRFTNVDAIPAGSIKLVRFPTFVLPVCKALQDGDTLSFVPDA